MIDFIKIILECTISMSFISLLFYVIKHFLKDRYNAKCFYYSWLIIIVGYIIPFRPSLEFNILPRSMNKINELDLTSTIGQIIKGESLIDKNVQAAGSISGISIYQLLFIIWLIGFGFVILYQTIRHCRFIYLIQRWSDGVEDKQTIAALRNLRSEMKISTLIGCKKCDVISSPVLVGIFKPVILLPNNYVAPDDLNLILKHELVHYKRKDIWIKAMTVAAQAIHWFNPFVYLLVKEIALQCELSCDMEVINSVDNDIKHRYGKVIISMLRNQYIVHTALTTNFYGGKENMKKRLIGVMDTKKKKLGIALISGVLMLTLGIGTALASEKPRSPETAAIQNKTGEKLATANMLEEAVALKEAKESEAESTVAEDVKGEEGEIPRLVADSDGGDKVTTRLVEDREGEGKVTTRLVEDSDREEKTTTRLVEDSEGEENVVMVEAPGLVTSSKETVIVEP